MHNKYWSSSSRRVLKYRLYEFSTNFIYTYTHTHTHNCKIQPNNILLLFLKSILFVCFFFNWAEVLIIKLMNSSAWTAWVMLQSNFLDHFMYCSEDYWIKSVAVSSLKYFQNFTHPPRCNNCKAYLAFSAWPLRYYTELNPNLKYKLFEKAYDAFFKINLVNKT